MVGAGAHDRAACTAWVHSGLGRLRPCSGRPCVLLCRDITKASQFLVFRYTKYYHRMAGTDLAMDMLNDPAVQDVMQVSSEASTRPMRLSASASSQERVSLTQARAPSFCPSLPSQPRSLPHHTPATSTTTHWTPSPVYRSGPTLSQVFLKSREWLPLKEPVIKVEVEAVPASLTRMDLFDKIAEPGKGADPPIVRGAGGDLVKRMDDTREGFNVGGGGHGTRRGGVEGWVGGGGLGGPGGGPGFQCLCCCCCCRCASACETRRVQGILRCKLDVRCVGLRAAQGSTPHPARAHTLTALLFSRRCRSQTDQ